MPMAYFKCECGTEHREIVPINTDGYQDLGNGRKRFVGVSAPAKEQVHTCTDCGSRVKSTDDPRAVKSGVYFNWLADD